MSKVTSRLRTGESEEKIREEGLVERWIEGSGIFYIWPDTCRLIMRNSVLEWLMKRRLDDIDWDIWFTTLSTYSCASEVEKGLVRRIWRVGCHLHRDGSQQKWILWNSLMEWFPWWKEMGQNWGLRDTTGERSHLVIMNLDLTNNYYLSGCKQLSFSSHILLTMVEKFGLFLLCFWMASIKWI